MRLRIVKGGRADYVSSLVKEVDTRVGLLGVREMQIDMMPVSDAEKRNPITGREEEDT